MADFYVVSGELGTSFVEFSEDEESEFNRALIGDEELGLSDSDCASPVAFVSDSVSEDKAGTCSVYRENKNERRQPSPSVSSEDDEFEQFLTAVKTPKKTPLSENKPMCDFIVDSDEEAESWEGIREPWTPSPSPPPLTSSRTLPPPRSPKSGDDKENSTPETFIMVHSPKSRRKKKTIKGKMRTIGAAASEPDLVSRMAAVNLETSETEDEQFLKSLSPLLPAHRRSTKAQIFIDNFKKKKEDLAGKLFSIYNSRVFDGKLPHDLEIRWNLRLRKTAGFCCLRRGAGGLRTVRIELSDKVCDSAERVRDTLIHELCHAAVWILHDLSNVGHGKEWKLWARRVSLVFPDIPLVTRCHSYEIRAKFIYSCVRCDQRIQRHSKSLDTERKVCGVCGGRFELLRNKPDCTPARPPPRFALFVKENYSAIKKATGRMSHKEVMTVLGEQFKQMNVRAQEDFPVV